VISVKVQMIALNFCLISKIFYVDLISIKILGHNSNLKRWQNCLPIQSLYLNDKELNEKTRYGRD